MNRSFRILALGDVDQTLRVRPAKDLQKSLEAYARSGHMNDTPLWILLPEETERPVPPVLAARVRRVKHLREAVRFVESLKACPEDVEELLADRPGELPEQEQILPLRGEVGRVFQGNVPIRERGDVGEPGPVVLPLYTGETVRRLWEEETSRWVVVEGPAGSGKSLWLRYVRRVLEREGVPVIRIQADRYRWGDRGWAEEIARAAAVTGGRRDGPAVSLLVRWLDEGIFRGGVLMLDGVEGAVPWERFLEVLEGLVREWRGPVVVAGRAAGMARLEEVWRGGRNVLPDEVLRLRIRGVVWDDAQAWLEGALGEEAGRFWRWVGGLDLRRTPGTLRMLVGLYDPERRGTKRVYEGLWKAGIREGLERIGGAVNERLVDVIYRALSRTFAVVMGAFQEFTPTTRGMAAYFIANRGIHAGYPNTIVWDSSLECLLRKFGRETDEEAWQQVESRIQEILVQGLHRAGIWTALDHGDGRVALTFENVQPVRFLTELGSWEVWHGVSLEGEEDVFLQLQELWEKGPREGRTLESLARVTPEAFQKLLERNVKREKPETFLARLLDVVGPRTGSMVGSWLLERKEEQLVAWLRHSRASVRERTLEVLRALSGYGWTGEVAAFWGRHPDLLDGLFSDEEPVQKRFVEMLGEMLKENRAPGVEHLFAGFFDRMESWLEKGGETRRRALELLAQLLKWHEFFVPPLYEEGRARMWRFWETHERLMESILDDPDATVRSALGKILKHLITPLLEHRPGTLEKILQSRYADMRRKGVDRLHWIVLFEGRDLARAVLEFLRSRENLVKRLLGDSDVQVRGTMEKLIDLLHRRFPEVAELEAHPRSHQPESVEQCEERKDREVKKGEDPEERKERIQHVWNHHPDQFPEFLKDTRSVEAWDAVLVLHRVFSGSPESVVAFVAQHLNLFEDLLVHGKNLVVQETLRLLQKVFSRRPALAWKIREERIPHREARWLVRSFRILDEASRAGETRHPQIGASDREAEPVEILWEQENDCGGFWDEEIRVGCAGDDGRPVEVIGTWRSRQDTRNILHIRVCRGEDDTLLRGVWQEFRRDADPSGGMEVGVCVNAPAKVLKGGLRFGVLLVLALMARRGAEPGGA